MAFFRDETVRGAARQRAHEVGVSVAAALANVAQRRAAHFDIFLSQTIRDAEIVYGTYVVLTKMGLTVFCDWVDSPEAERRDVLPEDAAFIREMMGCSDTLLFLDTEGSAQSLWMCWELGWFDGGKGPVAVLPVLTGPTTEYRGREFLGLYPYVEIDESGGLRIVRPVVTTRSGISLFEAPNSRRFETWRSGGDWMRPRSTDPFGGLRR